MLKSLSEKKFSFGFAVFVLILLGFIVYANSFPNKMFWDDDDNILKNRFVQDWHYIPKYFSENLIAGAGFTSNYWRPMLLLVFSLEWHIWRNWAVGYHFVNTGFHIANALLLFLILFYFLDSLGSNYIVKEKARLLSFFTALAFLVHPLQTEAVTYVSGLGDPLCVFFIFLGILFYLKFRLSGKNPFESRHYFFSVLMYVLALMTKEIALIMPAFIILFDFFFLHFAGKEKLKKIGKAILPFLALFGFYVLLRATALNFSNSFNLYNESNVFTSNFHIRLFTFFRILTIYFGLLFLPLNLHMERNVALAFSFFSFSVILGCLILAGLLVLAFWKFKKYPILSFGILWFFIGLFPVSNLVLPINGLLYEHWLYLPLIGIFLIFIWLGIKIAEKIPAAFRNVLLSLFFLYLVFFGVLTIKQNALWRNPVTFYNYILQYAPDSYRVVNNLGMAYANAGDYKKAEETYQKAVSLSPGNAVAHHNLGNTYKETGRIDLAIEKFNTAIELDPKFIFSYNSLANIYLGQKDYKQARKVFEEYIEKNGPSLDTLFLLAQIALEEKDFDGALFYLEKASEINPQNRDIQTAITGVKNLKDLKNAK